jgi:hypothetical protein
MVAAGNINMAAPVRQETVNDLLDSHIRGICLRTGHIWSVTGNNNAGKLELFLNYYPRREIVVDYLIEEGVNLETPNVGDILVEDGDVYNDILGTGDSGIQEDVLAYQAQNDNSIAEYGLRQTIESFPGNVESATIKKNTDEFLAEHREAVRSINPILPFTDEVASMIIMNCSMPVKLHSAGFKPDGTIGFDGYAPVRSVTIDEFNKRISLIMGADF